MPQISVARLFEDNREKLGFTWVAGKEGAARVLDSDLLAASTKGLIGHLNVIHPNWIQVISASESDYANKLDSERMRHVMEQLAAGAPVCLIVAGVEGAPDALRKFAEASQTPLLHSPKPSLEMMWLLRHYMAKALAESSTLHGVFLDVLGMGVLITGESGVGKSELGLELISRGSGLVADDIVELYRVAPETLEGRCPPLLRDFLEVRGLGVLNIRTIFGETAVRPRKNLKLIVQLEKPAGSELPPLERLPLKPTIEDIVGVKIRKVIIPVAAGRNLAVLVEAAVRNTILQLRGIDSTLEFLSRHELHMNDAGEHKPEK
ncbi:MAG: HPr kinase/phosphorylase [Betaproteobacteria bacterium]|nr:HPr kinase/phosphorylase [Betaproteobacteria bacterium]